MRKVIITLAILLVCCSEEILYKSINEAYLLKFMDNKELSYKILSKAIGGIDENLRNNAEVSEMLGELIFVELRDNTEVFLRVFQDVTERNDSFRKCIISDCIYDGWDETRSSLDSIKRNITSSKASPEIKDEVSIIINKIIEDVFE